MDVIDWKLFRLLTKVLFCDNGSTESFNYGYEFPQCVLAYKLANIHPHVGQATKKMLFCLLHISQT